APQTVSLSPWVSPQYCLSHRDRCPSETLPTPRCAPVCGRVASGVRRQRWLGEATPSGARLVRLGLLRTAGQGVCQLSGSDACRTAHKILSVWSQNNSLALSYATTKLLLALTEVMMVRFGVLIKNDSSY